MPFTRADVDEMRVLTERLQQGSVSRRDWSNLTALVIMAQGDTLCALIRAHGFDEFLRICRPILDGHAFRFSDFKRIYARICRAGGVVQ